MSPNVPKTKEIAEDLKKLGQKMRFLVKICKEAENEIETGIAMELVSRELTADVLTTPTDTLDFCEQPARFDAEHGLWTRCGRPRPPSTDDLHAAALLGPASTQALALRRHHHDTGAAWDAFCELLDALAHTGRPLHTAHRR